MPLDPQFRAILDTLENSGLTPLIRGDAAQTRAHYRTLSLSRRGPGFVPEEVASVADLRSPGGVPVRVYEPLTPGGFTLIYLHGGGWVVGDVETHDPLCRRVANETGARVVSVDYRLAPEHPFPAALDDAEEVLGWLRAQDPQRPVGVAGDSAGRRGAGGPAGRRRGRRGAVRGRPPATRRPSAWSSRARRPATTSSTSTPRPAPLTGRWPACSPPATG